MLRPIKGDNRGKQSIITATILVSLLVIVSKILGFVREAIIAAYFGANEYTDAFFLAQNMPSMLFPAVCNSVSIAFTSLYVKRINEDDVTGDLYGSRMLNASFILGVLLSVFGLIISPIIVPVFAPGFKGAQLELAILLTRLTMSAFSLTMLTYMLTAILNSRRFFIGAQIAGVLHNVVLILCLFVFGPGQSMEFLTITFVFGLFVQVLVLVLCCKNKFTYHFLVNPFHEETKRLVLLSTPILLGNCVSQINSIVDKMLSSTLGNGSVSSLSYATTLYTVVVSVFIMSLSSVLYPSLIDHIANNDKDGLSRDLIRSLLMLSLALFIISAISIYDSNTIVRIVFGRGNFDSIAVKNTSAALLFYCPCFVFYGIREALSKLFYAIQDSKTPMINSAVGVIVNIITSISLVRIMGIAGIALGTTVSAIVSSILLMISTRKRFAYIKLKKLYKPMLLQLLVATISVALLYGFDRFVIINSDIIRFSLHIIIGFTSYFIMLQFFGDEYSRLLVKKVVAIFNKKMN